MFISRLQNAGINLTAKDFEKNVDKCFRYMFNEIKTISSDTMAADIFKRGVRRTGVSTRLLQTEEKEGIILDGDVPGAESNKAFFEFVLVNGTPMVFKYAQSTDAKQEELVLKDSRFTNILKTKLNYFPEGLVHYEEFSIKKANNGATLIGTLSPHYSMTLHSLSARPLPSNYVLSLGQQVLDVINKVHSVDFSINDIKPSNIFITSTGKVCVGDFGGYTPLLADRLVEYSAEYLPEELHLQPVTKVNDIACLASTLLELMNQKPHEITMSTLRTAARLVRDEALKNFIVELVD